MNRTALARLARTFTTSTPSPARFLSTAVPSTSTPSAPPRPVPTPRSSPGTTLYNPPTPVILAHLEDLLGPLGCALEEEQAVKSLTHKSSVGKGESSAGHGEKLTFVGRRVLRTHLALHLSSSLASSPILLAQFLSQPSVDAILDTKELGASVGRAWGLEKALRWREVRGVTGEPSGLYKSRGAAVEAVVGAVYVRHGIAATSKVFSQLVLPNLSLPKTLASAMDAPVVVEEESPRVVA